MVANYYGVSKKLVDVPGRKIHWAGDRDSSPPDTPPCGFDNSKCPDNSESLFRKTELHVILVLAVCNLYQNIGRVVSDH